MNLKNEKLLIYKIRENILLGRSRKDNEIQLYL
jgi:hypothetical protein